MLLRGTPLDAIGESDLQALVDNRTAEIRTIEYKEKLHQPADGPRKEFLADISSFANALGGHIIYGISEHGGVPDRLVGMDVSNPDQVWVGLESSIRDGIAPRIAGVRSKWLQLPATGRWALIIEIPRSHASPHRVNFAGSNRFYSRDTSSKFEMDVQQLREAFAAGPGLADRIRDHLVERLARIKGRHTTVPLDGGAVTAVHVMPAGAVGQLSAQNVSLDEEVLRRHLFPLYSDGIGAHRHTLDGYLTWVGTDQTCRKYALLFRNGTIETADIGLLDCRHGSEGIPGIAFEKEIIASVKRYLRLAGVLGLAAPVVLSVALTGVRGLGMLVGPRFGMWEDHRIDRDDCLLPTVWLESLEADVGRSLRPAFDALWNAAGWSGSLNYDDDSNWRPHER